MNARQHSRNTFERFVSSERPLPIKQLLPLEARVLLAFVFLRDFIVPVTCEINERKQHPTTSWIVYIAINNHTRD